MNGHDAPGLFRRLAVVLYDGLLVLGACMMLTLGLLTLSDGEAIRPGALWYQGLLMVLMFFFYGWFWTHGGQTPGMMAWRVRVLREDGTALRWRDTALRMISAVPSAALLGLGFLWIVVDPQRRAWHDRLSRTCMLRVQP